jgi:hypothetical protein
MSSIRTKIERRIGTGSNGRGRGNGYVWWHRANGREEHPGTYRNHHSRMTKSRYPSRSEDRCKTTFGRDDQQDHHFSRIGNCRRPDFPGKTSTKSSTCRARHPYLSRPHQVFLRSGSNRRSLSPLPQLLLFLTFKSNKRSLYLEP